MNPLLRSRAKYTRPNFPFPNGRPISNMPRWNCFGASSCFGIVEGRRSATADFRDDSSDTPTAAFCGAGSDTIDSVELDSLAAREGTAADFDMVL